MAETPDSPFPHPPFPHPDEKVLWVLINNSLEALRTGEADAQLAIVHTAVHAWYEGHIEGEDLCPGCTLRGDIDLRRNLSKLLNPYSN